MKLYSELANWWHLLSSPEDYRDEAESVRSLVLENVEGRAETMLELGAGGGNNALFLKKHFKLTLSDLSENMLAVSRGLNPECEHVCGDMRSLRLGRKFDAVLIHDAIMYMTTSEDLRSAIETAASHCREGGVVILVPDCLRETFVGRTTHGGHDDGQRALRYLMWEYDENPHDRTFLTHFSYMLRDGNKPLDVEFETHTLGLFSMKEWTELIESCGLAVTAVPKDQERWVFIGRKTRCV